MIFNGKFQTPIFDIRRKPVPIAGDGTMELDPGGIRVAGHRAASRTPRVMLWIAIITVAVLVDQLVLESSTHGLVTFVSAFSVALLAGVRRATRAPKAVLYPWSALRDVKRLADELVVLRFRGRSASGDLFFRPDDGANALVEMLDFARGAEDLTRVAA